MGIGHWDILGRWGYGRNIKRHSNIGGEMFPRISVTPKMELQLVAGWSMSSCLSVFKRIFGLPQYHLAAWPILIYLPCLQLRVYRGLFKFSLEQDS